jgi:hypothetical protein
MVSTGIGRNETPSPATSGMWNEVSATWRKSKFVAAPEKKSGVLNCGPYL